MSARSVWNRPQMTIAPPDGDVRQQGRPGPSLSSLMLLSSRLTGCSRKAAGKNRQDDQVIIVAFGNTNARPLSGRCATGLGGAKPLVGEPSHQDEQRLVTEPEITAGGSSRECPPSAEHLDGERLASSPGRQPMRRKPAEQDGSSTLSYQEYDPLWRGVHSRRPYNHQRRWAHGTTRATPHTHDPAPREDP